MVASRRALARSLEALEDSKDELDLPPAVELLRLDEPDDDFVSSGWNVGGASGGGAAAARRDPITAVSKRPEGEVTRGEGLGGAAVASSGGSVAEPPQLGHAVGPSPEETR
jgi:hypothetical protein